ncbi:hypothetical protein H8K33_12815 [Undibacterium amnicola]|uniref:Uncharacterized protein n=1 Tax=Undibacterium amnicola TaxID=1834038 RepID=A0ABR6XSR8_9BURK|nr:hypothetical protein [Undibacterium amnicola]MBC3832398.1 hypothetical protein [Undibacterium amnicola]
MSNTVKREDPIRENHYRPLELAEKISDGIFYVGVCLSIAVLIVDKKAHPSVSQFFQHVFEIVGIVFFGLGIFIRLYFFPRAEDARRKDFLSNVFNIELTHERTVGYYNNEEKEPYRRLILCVLENAFFSKSILLKMLALERAKVLLCAGVFSLLVFYREGTLDWTIICVHLLFSETIISKWIRMEWLRNRAEKLFQKMISLISVHPKNALIQVHAIDLFGEYETGKTLCGILQSGSVFEKMNPCLSLEWEKIKKSLASI